MNNAGYRILWSKEEREKLESDVRFESCATNGYVNLVVYNIKINYIFILFSQKRGGYLTQQALTLSTTSLVYYKHGYLEEVRG